MNKNFCLISILIIVTFIFYSCVKDVNTNPDNSFKNYIKVKGTKLYDPNSSDYFYIKSMGLGNDAFNSDTTFMSTEEIQPRHHSERSYKELADLGFNTVRYYMAYLWFETNEAAVFSEIDKNISFAKKNNIHIILDMHTPPGTRRKDDKVNDYKADLFKYENKIKFVNIWKKIADTYKDEPVILGYDISNEPQVPAVKVNEQIDKVKSLEAWTNLAQECIDEIRKVDKNHIIFVERITGIQNPWSYPDLTECYPKVTDDNMVFQAHFYGPNDVDPWYSHQKANRTPFNKQSQIIKYPGKFIIPNKQKNLEWEWKGYDQYNFPEILYTTGWYTYTYSIQNWDSSYNGIRVIIKTGRINNNCFACIDDVVLKKINKTNNQETVIKEWHFNTKQECDEWELKKQKGSSTVSVTEYEKYDYEGYIRIRPTDDWWSIVSAPVSSTELLEDGYKYVMSAKVKYENQTGSDGCYGFDFYKTDESNISEISKTIIEKTIREWKQYPAERNKPLFIGESGCIRNCFTDDCGVEQYLTDCAAVFNNFCCGYNYHAYHEDNFGLHWSSSGTPIFSGSDSVNTKLQTILKTINRKNR